MKTKLLKSLLVLFAMLPMLVVAVHAQANKTVTVPGDAIYTGTYNYLGERNSHPYYKHATQNCYLYVDNYCGSYGNLWMLASALVVNPNDAYVKYYQWAVSNPADNPGDPDWWDVTTNCDNGNCQQSITIVDAVAGAAPTVSTDAASLVTTTSGTMNGNIVADGGATTDRGFVYSSTDATPTIGEGGVTQVTKGTGTGTFSEQIGSLTAGVTYYYQAYGHNTYGTIYGGISSFTTPTTSQPNKYLSGVTSPAGANGVYVWIGNYYNKPAWKHQTSNYWIYYSITGWNSSYYWYIDDELKNSHGSYDYLFYHDDVASCPGSGWVADDGTGTPSIIDYPNIAFTNGTAYSPGNPTGGNTNYPIGRFMLSGELAGANLTGAAITVTGTRTNVSNLKLWSSTDATFNSGSDTQLNSQSDGATVTFSGFSSAIATSGTYYFITADLSSSANGTIALTIGSQANLTITGGAIASGFANAALTSGALTITPVKEINIKGNNVSIANGDVSPSLGDHTDFGSVDIALAGLARTFTIENSGASTLTLTDADNNYIAITGHTDDFYLTEIPSSSIAGGGSTTFQITFNPTTTGLRSAIISIANDDLDEDPYTFAIQGTGTVAPEIEIVGNGLIPNGDNTPSVDDYTDFGTASVATGSVQQSFGIVNVGSTTLNLTGSSPYVSIGGANSADFSVTTPPANVIPSGGSSSTFAITFNPSAVGLRSATVSVANDDADENPYTFAIQGTGIAPEINLKQGVTSIADGGSYNFSNQLLSSNTDVEFTIENTGTDDLEISTPISIDGANADQFSILTQPESSVAAPGTTTFTVRFTPTAVGAQTATISIANNDGNENPYLLTITGTGIAPEINLKQGITSIADGGSYDFSNHLLSSNTDVVFTIENTGAANLTLTTPISIDGANADQFSIQAQPGSPVAAAGTTTFTVRFTPTSIGAQTATISLANNDDDENPYLLTITGTGIAPEMDLKQGVTPIADGGSYDFSNHLLTTNTDVVFTIENSGTANLTLTTPIAVGGANADQFSIQSQPTSPVAASGTTTFTVRFTPTSTGAKAATISIANNDGNENPYDLTITGTGVVPEISISGNGNEIVNGDASPSSTDFTDFGSVDISSGTSARSFIISNSGAGQLNLTGGSPYVAIGGANAADFSVTAIPSNSIAAAGGSTTFEITFNPSAIGNRSATISIANNDTDENPYTFSILGTGTNVPTTQSSNFSQVLANASALNISWTRGDGSNCAVFVQEGTMSGTFTPSDNTTYSPSADWNAKTADLGAGWYCVYVGNNANPSVNLTNLAQGEWYRIAAFEYNSTPGNEKYLATSAASNPISFHTLTNSASVSAGFDATHTGAEANKYWNVRYFNSLANAISGSATGATLTVRSSNGSTSTTTADLDADANPIIIDDGDLVVTGTITAATHQIQAIGTGYLVQSPAQNVAKTYPIGDDANNYTATITCANAPTQPIKMKINNNRVVSGSSSVDFWDISGETGLNARIKLRIPKSALKSGSWSSSNQIRIYNGSRYVPVPAARVSVVHFANYVELTITAINTF